MTYPTSTKRAIVTAITIAVAVMVFASRASATIAQEPPDFREPCELKCVIYGIAPAAAGGVFWIDVCNRTTGLIPGSPVNMNVGAAKHPDSLYLGGGGQLNAWRIGSLLPPINLVPLPPFTVALTGDKYNFVYAGPNAGVDAGNLFRVFPPTGLLGPGAGASPYIGDLAYQYSPAFIPPIVGSTVVGGVTSLVDVNRGNGSQAGPRATNGLGGLAYDNFFNQLWGEDAFGQLFAINRTTGVPTFWMNISVLIQDLASTPRCGDEGPDADLGDAPDSTNHASIAMTAYPAVTALYPTVYDILAATLPHGPLHWQPQVDHWLGPKVSLETDADLLPDQDLITNIDPPTDTPDRDNFDDGVVYPINLPACQLTTFQYNVSIVGPVRNRYTNVWFDFNRNGIWGEQIQCGSDTVNEWAVQNQVHTLGSGVHLLTTPAFRALDTDEDVWMRVGASDIAAPAADGQGVPGGYEAGETEDYLLHNVADDEYEP